MAIIRFLPKFDLVFNTDKNRFEWVDPADNFYDSISGKVITEVTLSGIFWLTLTLKSKNGDVKQFTQFRFGLDVSKLKESLDVYKQYVWDSHQREVHELVEECHKASVTDGGSDKASIAKEDNLLDEEEKFTSIVPVVSPYYRDGNQTDLVSDHPVEYASTSTQPEYVDHHKEAIKAAGLSFEEVMNVEIMKSRIRERLMVNLDEEFDEDNLEIRFVGMKDFIRDTRNYLREISAREEGSECSNADALEPSSPELKVVDEIDDNEADDENYAFPADNSNEPKPKRGADEKTVLTAILEGPGILSADYARSHSTNSGDQYRYLEEFSIGVKWDIRNDYGDIMFIDNVKRVFRRAIPGRLFVTIPFELIDDMDFNEDEIILLLKPEFENYHVFPKGNFVRFSLSGKTRRSRKEFEDKLIRMRKRIKG